MKHEKEQEREESFSDTTQTVSFFFITEQSQSSFIYDKIYTHTIIFMEALHEKHPSPYTYMHSVSCIIVMLIYTIFLFVFVYTSQTQR